MKIKRPTAVPPLVAIVMTMSALPLVALAAVEIATTDFFPRTVIPADLVESEQEFRVNRRLRRLQRQQENVSSSALSVSSVSSSGSEDTGTGATEATYRPLMIEDLTIPQRETLRRQLRIGGCPQEAGVLEAYRDLCERMLKAIKKSQRIRLGPQNPEQGRREWLREQRLQGSDE